MSINGLGGGVDKEGAECINNEAVAKLKGRGNDHPY
jgi:hypothetical protein